MSGAPGQAPPYGSYQTGGGYPTAPSGGQVPGQEAQSTFRSHWQPAIQVPIATSFVPGYQQRQQQQQQQQGQPPVGLRASGGLATQGMPPNAVPRMPRAPATSSFTSQPAHYGSQGTLPQASGSSMGPPGCTSQGAPSVSSAAGYLPHQQAPSGYSSLRASGGLPSSSVGSLRSSGGMTMDPSNPYGSLMAAAPASSFAAPPAYQPQAVYGSSSPLAPSSPVVPRQATAAAAPSSSSDIMERLRNLTGAPGPSPPLAGNTRMSASGALSSASAIPSLGHCGHSDSSPALLQAASAQQASEGGVDDEEEEPEEMRQMRIRLLKLYTPPPHHEVHDQQVAFAYEDDVEQPEEREAIEPDAADAVGASTPDECGMIVRWRDPKAPIEKEDLSKAMTVSQQKEFMKQKELVPSDYQAIADDPRFKRLKNKWAPNIFSKKGCKQYVKTLPYIGLMFHAHHACDSINSIDRLRKIKKTASNEALDSTFKTMKGAQRSRAIQETAFTGVGAAMMLLPLFDVVPGLGPNLMIVGQVFTEVAEKGLSMGIRVLVSESACAVGQAAVTPQKSFGTYEETKAFLMYLGAPYNPDPLYAQWEDARIRLKTLYGCKPEDDLFKMKPKGALLEQLRREEENSKMAYVAEVPLLLLLFRTFHCWDELYYDKLMKKKDSALNISKAVLLNSATTRASVEERRRKRDLKKLQGTAALVESKKEAIDPHLKLLNSTYKKDVVHVLCESFLSSNRLAFLFTDRKPRSFQRSSIKLFMKTIVEYFYDHNAYVWGYVAEDHRILGVAIWDCPDPTAKMSLAGLISVSALKLGPSRFKEMTDLMGVLEDMRSEDIRGVKCWMVHWLGVLPIASRQGIGKLLIENCMERHPEPLYVQLLSVEEEAQEFFAQCRFKELRTAPTHATHQGTPINITSMWLGVESPDALRQMPVKSKGRLALTYSALRKAAVTSGLMLNAGGDKGPSPFMLQSAEYVMAKHALEEARRELQDIQRQLAVDDDLYSGLDKKKDRQEAQVAILEQELLQIQRSLSSTSGRNRARSSSSSSGSSSTAKQIISSVTITDGGDLASPTQPRKSALSRSLRPQRALPTPHLLSHQASSPAILAENRPGRSLPRPPAPEAAVVCSESAEVPASEELMPRRDSFVFPARPLPVPSSDAPPALPPRDAS